MESRNGYFFAITFNAAKILFKSSKSAMTSMRAFIFIRSGIWPGVSQYLKAVTIERDLDGNFGEQRSLTLDTLR